MRRIVEDQRGIVMPLAIILVLLVGVMGAGLLAYVASDLSSIVESNKGQKALEISDAGAEAARVRLLSEAYPSAYDSDDTSNPDYINKECNNDGGWNPLPIPRPDSAGNGFWNPDFGVVRDFNDGAFKVEMRYLSPVSPDNRCKSPLSVNNNSKYKEVDGRTFPTPRIDAGFYQAVSIGCFPGTFKKDSNGKYTNECENPRAAKRKIEVIYRTSELDSPLALYSRNIENREEGFGREFDRSVRIGPEACIEDVNVFTMGGVGIFGDGSCEEDENTVNYRGLRHLRDSGDNDLTPETAKKTYGGPFDYGNWLRSEYDNYAHLRGEKPYENDNPFNVDNSDANGNKYNSKARPVVSAGIGAVGDIDKYFGGSNPTRIPGRDYDKDGSTGGFINSSNPRFVKKSTPTASQANNQITFPFDYKSVEGQADKQRMDTLRSEALRQQGYNQAPNSKNYIEPSNGSTINFTSNGSGGGNYKWPQYTQRGNAGPEPTTSDYNTVVYVRFPDKNPNNKVVWRVNHNGSGCDGEPEKGILVVENGNVEVETEKTPFHGMVILRGADPTDTAPVVSNFIQQGFSGGLIGDAEAGQFACTGGGVDITGQLTLLGKTTNIDPRGSAISRHNTGDFYVRDVDMPGTVGFHTVKFWSWREVYE